MELWNSESEGSWEEDSSDWEADNYGVAQQEERKSQVALRLRRMLLGGSSESGSESGDSYESNEE